VNYWYFHHWRQMDPKHISQALLTWFLCIIFVIWRRKISPNHILGHICGHPNNKNTWEFNHFLWSVKKRVCALFSDSFWTVIIVSTSLSFIWGGGNGTKHSHKVVSTLPNDKITWENEHFHVLPMTKWTLFLNSF
jgi:hypothetical protein